MATSEPPEEPDQPATKPSRTPLHLGVAYAAKAWHVVLALACTPVYVSQLGPAGFGVVGLFLAMQRMAALFDSGFSRTINREMAHRRGPQRSADMLRTLELVYLAVCAGLFLLAIGVGGWVIDPQSVGSAESTGLLVVLMAGAIAAQFPSTYYIAALAGMERHVTLNSVQMAWHTIRFVGAAAVLFVSPTLTAFLSWQLLTGLLFTAVVCGLAWSRSPGRFGQGRFDLRLLKSVGGYATGSTLCAVTAVLTTQMDKLILSKQLPAEEFGYYMIAWSIAASVFLAASPVGTVMFPRLARLTAEANPAALSRAYHAGSQLVTMTVVPLAAAGCLCSEEALYAWMGDRDIARSCAPLAGLIFAGVGVNCLSSMPQALQLASGWTGLTNLLNVASLTLFGPLIYLSCQYWGAHGAACAWLAFTVAYLFTQVMLMHRRLLPNDLRSWAGPQIAAIGLATLAAGGVRLLPTPQGRVASLALVALAWLAAACGAFIACKRIRERVWSRLTTRLLSVHRAEPLPVAATSTRT